MTFQNFLLSVGRAIEVLAGIVWRVTVFLGRVLWDLARPMLRGFARGAGRSAERAAPWIIGGLAVWYVVAFEPQLLGQLLALGLIILAIRMMYRAIFPAKKKS